MKKNSFFATSEQIDQLPTLYVLPSVEGKTVHDYQPLEPAIAGRWSLKHLTPWIDKEHTVSIEDYARGFVVEMRAHQTHGPYHVAGFSLGGTFAWEIVRQLEAMGETARLHLIAADAPVLWKNCDPEFHAGMVGFVIKLLLTEKYQVEGLEEVTAKESQQADQIDKGFTYAINELESRDGVDQNVIDSLWRTFSMLNALFRHPQPTEVLLSPVYMYRDNGDHFNGEHGWPKEQEFQMFLKTGESHPTLIGSEIFQEALLSNLQLDIASSLPMTK